MKLDRNDLICGYPAKKIRDFLGGTNGAFRSDDHCEPDDLDKIANDYFGDDAKAVMVALLKRGWIIKTKVDAEVAADTGMKTNLPIVSLTQAGKQSRIALLTKRFSRADGEVIVAELIKRAHAINAQDELLCGVSELRLFGSMLDPKAETVGDVDVAYKLYDKPPPSGKKRYEWHVERAKQAGRGNMYWGDQMRYGAIEVRLLLKARKPRLSLQDMFRFEELQPVPKCKVIFKADPCPPKGERKTHKPRRRSKTSTVKPALSY
jgi:hypothetical protein